MNKKNELIKMAKENTVVFIGPTAAGKDTIMCSISELTGVPILRSHTTRPMRPGELDGAEYYFVDNWTFDQINMIESREYKTEGTDLVWKYGLSEQEGTTHGLLILDWQGFLDFKNWRVNKGFEVPLAVFVAIEKEDSRRRQVKRGDYYEPEFERRWASDMTWAKDAADGSDFIWEGNE